MCPNEEAAKQNGSESGSEFWLGVDGGGTNTRAVIIDRAAKIRGEGQAEAANFLRVGLTAAANNIKYAVDEACAQAGISCSQIRKACFGLAGVGNPTHRRQMQETLANALKIPEMMLETDAHVALAGATDLAPGVVIIAGTGSIAYGTNAHGEHARAGGWGPAMGDEGSGYYIGRRALEAVVSAYDQRSSATSMTEEICHHFNVSTPPELPPVIYESPTKVMREVAQLSKIVVRAAREGDMVARGILTDAALELARAGVAVIKRLKMETSAFRVAYVGGVFEAGELVIAPMREAIKSIAPHAFVAPPLHPPMIGAARLAHLSRTQRERQVS